MMVIFHPECILVRALRGDARIALRRFDDPRRRRWPGHPARLQSAPIPRRSDVSGGAECQPAAVCGTCPAFAWIQVWPLQSILIIVT